MTRRALFALGGAAVALLTGCGRLFPKTYRFRMTVEVETPEGLKTGSSVYQVEAANTGEFLPEAAKRTWSLKGDALAVDLPGGHTMFALLRDLVRISMVTLDPTFRNDIVESADRIGRGQGLRSPSAVPPSDYPMLVMFRDVRDPRTIVQVDPENLAATFGSDMRLRSIVIAVTDQPVTKGLESRLTWLPAVRGSMLDGNKLNISKDLANNLSQDAFILGREL